MIATLRLQNEGILTIPSLIRQKYALQEGDVFTFIDMGDGSFFLATRISAVPKLVAEMEAMRQEADVSMAELLEGVAEERRQLFAEKYADDW